jgi:hypothetical protein
MKDGQIHRLTLFLLKEEIEKSESLIRLSFKTNFSHTPVEVFVRSRSTGASFVRNESEEKAD